MLAWAPPRLPTGGRRGAIAASRGRDRFAPDSPHRQAGWPVEHDVAYPDTMIRLRVDPKAVDGRFLSNVWNSRLLRWQIEAAARTTAGIYKINQGHIRNFVVPLCSSGEQAVVVDRLSAALSAVDAIESEVDRQLRKADTLRQSVLKEAFAGQLVAQDPKDEPAAVLLDRISAEREQSVKTTSPERKEEAAA